MYQKPKIFHLNKKRALLRGRRNTLSSLHEVAYKIPIRDGDFPPRILKHQDVRNTQQTGDKIIKKKEIRIPLLIPVTTE